MSTVTVSSRTGFPLIHVTGAGRVSCVAGGVERVLVQAVGPMVFVDVGAPLGQEVTYLLDSVVFGAVVVPAPDAPLDTVVTAFSGRDRVVTVWEGDAGINVDTRVELFYLPARRSPVTRMPLADGPVSGELECYVEKQDVYRLRSVLAKGRVWIKHAHTVCGEYCTLPETVLAVVESYSEASEADGRRFSFKWHQQHAGEIRDFGVAPGATFREARDEGFKFGDGSYLDFALRGAK